jgi:hypothetical protein
MNFDDRIKELVLYRSGRLCSCNCRTGYNWRGVNLLLGECLGLRLFLTIGGIILLAVIVGLIWRIWFLLQEDGHA